MSRFREARDRGGRFLASLMRPDGGVPDCETGGGAYWGYPIALMVSGHSNEASRLLNWVRKNQFTPEGAIGASEAEYKLSQFSYHIGWLAEGAHRLGQFDLSQRGVDYNMRFFDEESGGFYAHPTERSAETKQEVWITAGAGRGALYAGRFDVAKAVGRWFERLMDLQPEYPQRLYTIYSRAKGLHTEPDPGEDPRRYVFNSDAVSDENFFNPGISGGFLARLYMATGERKWLELSKEYMRQADYASDYLYTSLRGGKTAWGASLLYTGIPQIKPTFLDIAPSGIPSNIIPHSKGVKCGLIRSNSPFSYSNHRPAKPKIPKPLVYAQVSPLGTSFATP